MRRQLVVGTWAFILTAAITTVAGAQITAHQGAPIVAPEKKFVSPMVLEIPVPQLRGMKQAGRMGLAGVHEYSCEGVSIPNLVVAQSPYGKKIRNYEFYGFLKVEPSFDRSVTLTLELVDGGKRVLAQVTKEEISAEERKTTPFSIRLKAGEAMIDAIDFSENLTLRITMQVRED